MRRERPTLDKFLVQSIKRMKMDQQGQKLITQYVSTHTHTHEEDKRHQQTLTLSSIPERKSSSLRYIGRETHPVEEHREEEDSGTSNIESENEESIHEPEADPLKLHVTDTREQKTAILRLLQKYDVGKVYNMCNERIQLPTLKSWNAGIDKQRSGERKKGSGRKPEWPKVEEKLLEWFIFQRARALPINNKTLQSAARSVGEELSISNFKASKGYIEKFKKRHSLITRRRTRLSTKPVEEMKKLIQSFYEEINAMINLYTLENIWNYDEIPIYFEQNFSYTLARQGQKTVSILSVLANNMRMTLILEVSASGRKISLIMLFLSKGFTSFDIGEHLICSNSAGYATEEFIYAKALPHMLKYIGDNSLLIFDSCRAHLSGRVKELFSSHNIQHVAIPGGATCLLQPVDCGLGKMIKDGIKTEDETWCFTHFQAITTPEGRRNKKFQKPTNNQIGMWLVASSDRLSQEVIRKAFIETGITSKEKQAFVIETQIPRYYVDTKIEIDHLHYDEEQEIQGGEEKSSEEPGSEQENQKESDS